MPLTEAQKRYRIENREKVLACSKKSWPAYYAKNAEKYKARARLQRLTDSEKIKEQVRIKWKNRNQQKHLEEKRIWREKNRERIREYARQWKSKNRLRYRMAQRKHDALKKNAAVNLDGILDWMARIKRKTAVACYYCNKPTLTSEIHFDHIIALSNGGAHSVENLCVTCPFCNLSKGDKPLRAWIRMGQQILEL